MTEEDRAAFEEALLTSFPQETIELDGVEYTFFVLELEVRVGDSVHSPMVALGGADYLISFEALEAARAACYLKPGGTAIVNTQHILPMPVITGAAAYPDNPLSALASYRVESADALGIAVECGSQKALNLVLLGMFSRHLPFEEAAWRDAIAACVPQKTLEVNLAAFARGRALMG